MIELPEEKTERSLMRAIWEVYPKAEIIFLKVDISEEAPYNVEVSGGDVYGYGFGEDEAAALEHVIENLNKEL